MQDFYLEIVILVLLVLANGVFSMAEIAIVSSRKTRLQQLANEGKPKAAMALMLANQPKHFLATVQVGITLVGTLAGAYGGAKLTDRLAEVLVGIPVSDSTRMTLALVIVVVSVTYLQVVLGELAPKALALSNPERIAMRVAIPMHWLSRAAAPVVAFLGFSTDLLMRLTGTKPNAEPVMTSEEIGVMIAQGAEAGVFELGQQDMVESIIEMHERRISTLMTPRPDIVWLNVEDTADRLAEVLRENPHSRFPVCRGSLDEVLGVANMKDLLSDFLEGKPLDIGSRARKPLTIPETISITKALESMRSSTTHMAFVIDEYGSLQGLVTLKDILESIVGDLPSFDEDDDPEMVQREDGSWLVDGTTGIDDIKDLLQIGELRDEDEGAYQTMGGFVMTQLGRIPRAGDHFHADGFRYEVLDMDGHRVDKVLVNRESPPEPERKEKEKEKE